jgi:hypothetical protein
MKYTQEKQEQGKNLIQDLVTKSWESNSFKQQLVENPESVIEELTGSELTIPEGKKVVVEDQTDPNVIYINIPAELSVDDFELNHEQLEKVAGGVACGGLCIAGVLGGIAAGAQIIDWFGEGWNSVY